MSIQDPNDESTTRGTGTSGPRASVADHSTLRERVTDALRVLGASEMRIRVIGGTVAFSVVMLLGGVLTSLGDSLLLRLLAVVPALVLLGLVGAFGQFVLAVALQGLADADDPPVLAQLVRQSRHVLPRLAALGATFLVPGLLVVLLGQWSLGLPLLVVGVLLLPMAGALLLGTGDWRALSPVMVVTAIRRVGASAVVDVAVTSALFVPALVAVLVTIGQPAYAVIAVVGPLAAIPGLLAARVLGVTLCEHRHALAGLFLLPAVEDLSAGIVVTKPARPRAMPSVQARQATSAPGAIRGPARPTPAPQAQSEKPAAGTAKRSQAARGAIVGQPRAGG